MNRYMKCLSLNISGSSDNGVMQVFGVSGITGIGKMEKYVNFNDKSVPIGKRKQAYIKWAVSKGTELTTAKKQANTKFGFERKDGVFAIVRDYGRMNQYSFSGEMEIFQSVDLRKYKKFAWSLEYDEAKRSELKAKYEKMGWMVIFVDLAG